LNADERADALDQLVRRTLPTFDFFLFSFIAGVIFALGLLVDSLAILVLGAIVAPLMAPVVGISLGTVVGSAKHFGRSLAGLLIGSLLVFIAAAILGFFARYLMPLELDLAYTHAQLSLPGILLLIVGAIFTSVLMVFPDRSSKAPSVAIAYTVYLPLAVAGFGLTSGAPILWPDGLVVYTVHLTLAVLIGALTLAVLGFRPLTLFGYTFGGVVVLLGVVLVVGLSSLGAVLGAFGTPMAVPTQTPTITLTQTPIPPTATLTLTPVPPTDTPTLTVTPTPSATLTQTPTLTPTPVYALIDASEDSGGAFMRSDPSFDSSIQSVVANGTIVEILEDSVEGDGYFWAFIRVLTDGREGWILQSLLAIATPAPNW
jgi:hypothetical protein